MKRGITATTAVLIVVIVAILLGTISIASYESIQNANKLIFALEISDIQEEITRYNKDSIDNTYPITENIYNINIDQVTDASIAQFDGETENSAGNITLYEVDLESIDITDTKYGNKKSDKDVYVVSTETGKVYYLDGLKSKDKTYYTLTQDLIDIKERNEKSEDTKGDKPIITSRGFIVNIETDDSKSIYLNDIKVQGSDVQKIKYEKAMISESDAYEYFKTSGYLLSSDRIEVQEGDYITIYAEDSNGNWSIKYDGIPIIPTGFYYVGGSIPTGLVISDNILDSNKGTSITGDVVSDGLSGNQFVWIPVIASDNEFDTVFVTRDGYNNGAEASAVKNGNTMEPYNGEDLSLDNDLTGEWAEYYAMRASVKKYDGFYIARYEAGDADATEPRTLPTVEHTVVSKSGAYVYNNVPWGKSMTSVANFTLDEVTDVAGAVTLSRNMYKENEYVVSTLCYGVQWDSVMRFLEDIKNPTYVKNEYYINDSTGMGWHNTNYASGNPNHLTGIDMPNKENKVRNIYDLGGNVHELTMETRYYQETYYRTYRGGLFNLTGYTHPPSYRTISGTMAYSEKIGFRVALYVK